MEKVDHVLQSKLWRTIYNYHSMNYTKPYILPDHGNTKTIYIPKPYNEPFYIYIHIEEEPFHVKITPITIP